ncbi:MAG TPA: hypothetical protein VFR27_16405 [Mycobacterium sp.]|nr:hypothetical protein [Mycobacterium sp.]
MKLTKIAAPAVLLAAALTTVSLPSAYADNPAVGRGCDSGQLNLTTRSSAGEGLRCLADGARGYIWQPDTGATQTAADAARIAEGACQHAAAACNSIRGHLPGR